LIEVVFHQVDQGEAKAASPSEPVADPSVPCVCGTVPTGRRSVRTRFTDLGDARDPGNRKSPAP